jgi:predicted transposase YbfD/YdcC
LVEAETGVPVAMVRVSQKEGEGERCEQRAAQKLLGESGIENATVSCDALHCQQDTVREAQMSGLEVLVQVKGNQPSVLKACQRHAARHPPF